jgi:acyl carrier protein
VSESEDHASRREHVDRRRYPAAGSGRRPRDIDVRAPVRTRVEGFSKPIGVDGQGEVLLFGIALPRPAGLRGVSRRERSQTWICKPLARGGRSVTEAKLLEVVASAIRAEAENTRTLPIEANSRLVEDLGLDSIDIVAVTIRLEDRFHVSIDVQEVKELQYVSDLMDQMSRLLGKSAA